MAEISANGRAKGEGEPLDGHFTLKNGKFVRTQDVIRADIEEAARFIASMLNYSPLDVLRLNCYEFFRDLNRAELIADQHRKNLEKAKKRK